VEAEEDDNAELLVCAEVVLRLEVWTVDDEVLVAVVIEDVVVVLELEEATLDDDVELLVVVEVDVEVVVSVEDHENVAVAETGWPNAPQVALIKYPPFTQSAEPPATNESVYVPVVPFTVASSSKISCPVGLRTLRSTAVSGPGAGETSPDT